MGLGGPPDASFGDLLRRYRLAAGLTQEELAEKSQISPRAISDLERGQRTRPWRDTIQLLAQALHLDASDRARLEAAARPASPLALGAVGPRPRDNNSPPQHNLPAQLTSFVGREREVVELTERLRTTRLLTLTGIGGCGKTRLALRVGGGLLDAYADGVWLVELAPVGDPAFLAPTFARALGVAEDPPTPILRTLLGVLRSRRLLLLVDNCEHLIAACAELIETLVNACPNLTVLATSREALGIAGEVAWRVPSLPLPPRPPEAETLRPAYPGKGMAVTSRRGPKGAPTAAWVGETAESAAVRLFVDRAKAADPAFVVSPANATAVAQICWRLDGIPLALELAAARLKVLNVTQVADRLDDRFRLLTGGSRTALPRQQTLRATLDWSYNLLSKPERRTLRCLSVFSAGCTLEAAEAIAGVGDSASGGSGAGGPGVGTDTRYLTPLLTPPAGENNHPTPDTVSVLDLLSQLVDKSLVLVDKSVAEPRYAMPETVRQYGRDRLVEAEEAREARERHFSWFLTLAQTAESELLGARQVEWLTRLEADNADLRAALEWGLAADPEAGARLAGHLWQFWYFRSQISEGLRWLDAALDVAPPATALYAKLLAAKGLVVRDLGSADRRVRSKACSEEALTLCRKVGENRVAGWALNNLGTIATLPDTALGRALLQESVEAFRAAGDRAGVGMGLRDIGLTFFAEGEDSRARASMEESLLILREIGDNWNLGCTLAHFGALALRQKDYAGARAMAGEALALLREIGTTVLVLRAQLICGDAARLVGDVDEAKDLLIDVLRRYRASEVGPLYRIDRCLCSLANLAIQEGDRRLGVVLLGAGQSNLEIPASRAEIDLAENEASLVLARSILGEDTFAQAWAEGKAMTRAQAIAYALEADEG
jgi:non-specific serine/threonine protein kinase